MAKLLDYKCVYSEFKGLLKIDPEKYGLKVPELYQNAEDMVKTVLATRDEGGDPLLRLPIDTIALAENIGATVIYDTSTTGPRKNIDVVSSVKEVLDLPPADPTCGRMAEIMKGLRLLKDKGEEPVFAIHGLFDTLNGLIDMQKIIMEFAMDPALMQAVSDRIRNDIVTVCLAAEEAGARLITYSDGSGGINVIGPRFAKKVVECFLYPLMKELDEKLAPGTKVQMCPKSGFMLTGCDKADFKEIEEDKDEMWFENVLSAPEVRFTGTICNRELGTKKGGRLFYIELR